MSEQAPNAADFRDSLRKLRVLIVGGGAIGQVFGLQLQLGGAEVSYFLKPEHGEDFAEGVDLHRYGLVGVRPRRHFKPNEVFTDHRVLRRRTFDQIWLCVSSPALRSGFLDPLNDSCPNAIWVSFQPGIEDHDYLTKHVPANRLVTGLVNYIAYQAPLAGEDLWPAGIAFYVPPMSMTLFTGPEPYASAVANILQNADFPAGVRPDTVETARFGSSVLIPFVVSLESVGWSFEALRNNQVLLGMMTNSIEDIQNAIEKATGRGPGSFGFGVKPVAWRLGLMFAPKLASFPIETYFKHHFTKVRAQTDQMMDDFVQLCRDNAIIPRALESLRDQWRARRAAQLGGPIEPPRQAQITPATGVKVLPVTGASPAVQVAPAELPSGERRSSVIDPTRPLSTGAVPAITVPDEPTPPLGIETRRPQDAPVPAPKSVSAIEVDFDFHGDDGLDEDTSDGNFLEGAPAFVEEPTPQFLTLAPEPEPELDVDRSQAPILRSLADLDQIPAITTRPTAPAPKPAPVVNKPALPFEVDDLPEPDEQPRDLPSIIVDAEMLTDEQPREQMPTLVDPKAGPGEVHFRESVPDEMRGDIGRQDFIQTELANEEQNASLRELKSRLRSRLNAKQGLSPALKDNSDD